MKKSSLVWAGTACALALAFAGYLVAGPKAMAPNVGYTQLNGTKHQFADLRGQVVLVNFWATSCSTCVKEMPAIVATHDKYAARGFQTLAVAMSYDAPANVVNFAETRGLPFTVAIDLDGAIAQGFGRIAATPTTLLVDKQGRVVQRIVGEPDFAALHAHIERLLGAG